MPPLACGSTSKCKPAGRALLAPRLARQAEAFELARNLFAECSRLLLHRLERQIQVLQVFRRAWIADFTGDFVGN